jgi:hypothetical protein
MGRDLGSSENFDLASKRLKCCTTEHPRENCQPLRDTMLPTRVVDIGGPGRFEKPRIFHSAGRMGMYVALSHCWGGNVPLTTNHGCLNAYMEELPVSFLPQNFEDAMKITTELLFQYLWIDSLCIIQDPLQDWEYECAVMGDVYANASITISASAAKNSDDGILYPRLYKQPRLREHDVLLKLEEGSPFEDTVQVSSNYGHDDFADCVDGLPLGKRGRGLQERLLSQCVLHYTERQIYFQCRTSHIAANEAPPRGFYEVAVTRSSLLRFPNPTEKTSRMLLAEIYDWWISIIETYCIFRRLTFSSDKLPAILGLDIGFQKHLKDEYTSGFWRMDFRRSISWYTCKNKLNKVIRHETRAPSWSWARRDGNLRFLSKSLQIFEDYSVELLPRWRHVAV